MVSHDITPCEGVRGVEVETDRQTTLKVSYPLQVTLLYENESPMAHASFVAIFGERRIQGCTGADGRAVIVAPVNHDEETFVLVLQSFPERYIEGESVTTSRA